MATNQPRRQRVTSGTKQMKTYILKNKETGNFLSLKFENLQDAIKWANFAEKRNGMQVTIWRKENGNLSQVIYK